MCTKCSPRSFSIHSHDSVVFTFEDIRGITIRFLSVLILRATNLIFVLYLNNYCDYLHSNKFHFYVGMKTLIFFVLNINNKKMA